MAALALRYWWALVIAALLAVVGAQQLRLAHARTALAQYKMEVANAAREQAELARKESERKQREFDDAAATARQENAILEADVVRLAGAADGLRDELTAFKQRAKSGARPADRGASQPDSGALDLLADLYTRADREAAILARYADGLRIAGIACERAIDGRGG